jgi:hypothetical protein
MRSDALVVILRMYVTTSLGRAGRLREAPSRPELRAHVGPPGTYIGDIIVYQPCEEF